MKNTYWDAIVYTTHHTIIFTLNIGHHYSVPILSWLVDWLIDWLGFNDTPTLVGHFVSSPREREKRDRRASRDEREGQGRKRNRNENEETEEIKTFLHYPHLLQG